MKQIDGVARRRLLLRKLTDRLEDAIAPAPATETTGPCAARFSLSECKVGAMRAVHWQLRQTSGQSLVPRRTAG